MQVGDDNIGSLSSFGAADQVAGRPERTADRRLGRRYEVDLAIRVRVLSGSMASDWRVDTVLDLSGTGISFQCCQPLSVYSYRKGHRLALKEKQARSDLPTCIGRRGAKSRQKDRGADDFLSNGHRAGDLCGRQCRVR